MPYESQLYKNYSKPKISNYDIRNNGKLPDKEKFEKYYINDAFINVVIDTEDWGSYDRRGPYRIIVSMFSEESYSFAKINSISIRSINKQNNYKFTSDTFPLSFHYDDRQPGYSKLPESIKEGEYRSGADYNFDFKNKEKIEIEVNITISSNEKTKTKTIKCNFKPYSAKGLFRFIM